LFNFQSIKCLWPRPFISHFSIVSFLHVYLYDSSIFNPIFIQFTPFAKIELIERRDRENCVGEYSDRERERR